MGKGVQNLAKQVAVGGETPPACSARPRNWVEVLQEAASKEGHGGNTDSRNCSCQPSALVAHQLSNLSSSWLEALPKARSTWAPGK